MATMKRVLRRSSLVLIPLSLGAGLWLERLFMPLSFLFLLSALGGMHSRFEQRAVREEEVVLIASLAAIAAVSRVPFAAVPGVQPTSFVIVMSGVVLGPGAGFMIGSVGAFVSNVFLGQGPWTLWQMLAWGLMGVTSGWLGHRDRELSLAALCLFGFVWGFLFGWIMNVWVAVGLFEALNLEVVWTVVVASFFFDLAHGVSNVFFLLMFSRRWRLMLNRVIRKFGLFRNNAKRIPVGGE